METRPQPRVPDRFRRRCAALAFPLAVAAGVAACEGSPAEPDSCDAPLRLGVGEAAKVNPACDLRAETGATFVLAYYDTHFATAAETAYEPPYVDQRFSLTLADAAGTAASTRGTDFVAAIAPEIEPHFQMHAEGGPRPTVAVTPQGPVREGDRVTLRDEACVPVCEYRDARVARVADDWLVFAVEESTLGADAERVVGLFDQAAPLLFQHGIPLLRSMLSASLPVTSAASGQLVVIFQGDVSPGGGVTHIELRPEGTATHWIRLELSADLDVGKMLWLLAHEIAHAFQFEYVARNPPLAGPRSISGAARWGIEGGATLMDLETLRRAAGVPRGANRDYRATPASDVEKWLYQGAASGNGFLIGGYYAGAGFLRHLAAQRTERGESADDALREVVRGAMEGWNGIGPDDSRRPGLTQRMRARVPGWEPAEAVLHWTLSAAADDRMPNVSFQDADWLRRGNWELVGRGWTPDRIVQAGSGETVTMQRPAGTAGYFLVRSDGDGIRLSLTTPPSVRWMLLRVS